MGDAFWVAFFTSIPPTIVALSSIVIAVLSWLKSYRTEKDVQGVKTAINGMNGMNGHLPTTAENPFEQKG